MIIDSFLYCITDKLTNKLYIGVHKGTIDDGYLCSSKIVLQEYKKRYDDFSREIIAQGQYADMLKFESVVLKTLDAKNDPMLYNMHNGDGNFFYSHRTDEYKEKMRNIFKNRILSEHTKKKISESKKGLVISAETRLKMSLKRKGRKCSENFCENVKSRRLGTKIYTNEFTKEVKFFKENQQPKGWVLGRIV